MDAQHTLGWYRARLGNITGSKVGDIMKSGRKKDELFGDTAKTYIYQLAAERGMNPVIVEDDDLFSDYIMQVNVSTKAMEWGNEQEDAARKLYQTITGRRIVEVGSCHHPTIKHFASSPDGFFYDEENRGKGCIEIKCPNQSTFMKYKDLIHDNQSLLEVKPEYFYQCMAHMMCNDASWTDFIAYCPFQQKPIHIVRIYPDDKVFKEMEMRINEANKLINEILNR